MIKLLGVIAEGGTLVTIKTFKEMKEKHLVSHLIEAVKGISEAMGVGKIKKLDFGEDRLLLTETKKNYTVVALTDTAETYIEQLLQLIAEDIDTHEEVPSVNFVDNTLESSIEGIIETYINDELTISLHETLHELWEPILTEVKTNENITTRLEKLNRNIGEVSAMEERQWRKFKSNVGEISENPIDLALDGDFDHAFLASLGSEDTIQKMFTVKMGLLSFSILERNSPPLSEIEDLLTDLPKDDPFTNLLRMELKYKKQEIARPHLLHAFGTATTQFKFNDDKEDLFRAFLFINEVLGFFPEFGDQLAEYFTPKSEVITTFIKAVVERVRIIKKAYSITELEDIQEEINKWRQRANEASEKLDNVLKPGFLKRLFGRAPRGAEANRITFRNLMDIEVYMLLQATIAQSPVLDPLERRNKLNEVKAIYLNYFRKAINKGLPMPSSTLVNALQDFALVTQELATMPTPHEPGNISKNVRQLLKDTIDITVDHNTKISPYIQIILSVSDVLSVPDATKEDTDELPFGKGFLLLHSILKTTNIESVQSWKRIFPYNFAAYGINLLLALLPLALKFLEGNEKENIIKKCVDKLVILLKWLLFQGKASRATLLALTYYTTKVMQEYSVKKLDQLVDTLIGFTRIVVPDWEDHDYDLAVLGEYLLETIVQARKRLTNRDDLLQIAGKIYRISLNAWKEYGYMEKVRKLEERYEELLG